MKKIAILGSTGSIGTQTLEIVRQNEDLQVVALAAGSNVARMEEQIREFRPWVAAMWSEEACKDLKARVADTGVRICCGKESHTPASHANHSFPFHASAPPHPHLQETLFMPKSQIALKFPPENVILMKNQEERNGKHGKSGAGRDEKQREVYCI